MDTYVSMDENEGLQSIKVILKRISFALTRSICPHGAMSWKLGVQKHVSGIKISIFLDASWIFSSNSKCDALSLMPEFLNETPWLITKL
jgi:hypothetical protein